MRFYLDTEFHEESMTLISVGLVNQRGEKFYAVNTTWLSDKERQWNLSSQWLEDNVVPHLFPAKYVKHLGTAGESNDVYAPQDDVTLVLGDLHDIANAARKWCNLDQSLEAHEFWAYYADSDWVLFRRMFGTFDDMPMALPLLCLDLKQLALSAEITDSLTDLVKSIEPKHCALADAEWAKLAHEMFILQFQRTV